MQVFVEEDNVEFGVDKVSTVSNGMINAMFDGVVGVVFDGVVGVVSNCVVGVYVHLGVCDFFVGVAFGSFFDILTRVPFSNFNAFMTFGDQHKMASQVSWC